jgi:hypothetical protein
MPESKLEMFLRQNGIEASDDAIHGLEEEEEEEGDNHIRLDSSGDEAEGEDMEFPCVAPDGYTWSRWYVAAARYTVVLIKWPEHEGGWSQARVLRALDDGNFMVEYDGMPGPRKETLTEANYSDAPNAPFKSWVSLQRQGRSRARRK